jgi:hypothetical protein
MLFHEDNLRPATNIYDNRHYSKALAKKRFQDSRSARKLGKTFGKFRWKSAILERRRKIWRNYLIKQLMSFSNSTFVDCLWPKVTNGPSFLESLGKSTGFLIFNEIHNEK